MRRPLVTGATVGLVVLLTVSRVEAQSPPGRFEVGAQLTALRLNDFGDADNKVDYGVGGRLTYDLTDFVAVEGDLSVFPGSLGAFPSFSQRRIEGLFGAKIGTRGPGTSIFGILKPGFVRFEPSSEPLACILIFPQPLRCTLAGGRSEFAMALGGGVAVPVSDRLRGRLEVLDTLIRFGEPAIRDGRQVSEFASHHLQVNVGLGFRF